MDVFYGCAKLSDIRQEDLALLTFCHYIVKINDIMPRPKTTELTNVHKNVLIEVCRRFEAGNAATVGGLASSLKLAGPTSLMPTLKIMERNGYLALHGGNARGRRYTIAPTQKGQMALGYGGVPVLGAIPAGPLSEVFQDCETVESLGTAIQYKIGDFILKVQGDSMVGDGILSGDKVLLRPGVEPRNGEIAAVHYGDEYLATLKHVVFEPDSNLVILRASNPNYQDVRTSGSALKIAGVYRGLIRSVY